MALYMVEKEQRRLYRKFITAMSHIQKDMEKVQIIAREMFENSGRFCDKTGKKEVECYQKMKVLERVDGELEDGIIEYLR